MAQTRDGGSASSQVLRAIGSIGASTSLLSGLFIHFGMQDAIGYFRYFGINFTALGIPFFEYLTLSADSASVPLIYLAAATAVGTWLYRLPLRAATVRARRLVGRPLAVLAGVVGVALVGLALGDVLGYGRLFGTVVPEARGLSLATGALLMAFAGRLRRVLRAGHEPAVDLGGLARAAAVFLLVGVGLFWAVGSYAFGVGERRAADFAARLPCRPDAVVLSEKSLNLDVAGVRETVSPEPDGAYRFRYDGLKLVPQSGPQYVLLSGMWTPRDGVAVILPRSAEVRLEFRRSGDPGCG